jgi:hypothetical protein
VTVSRNTQKKEEEKEEENENILIFLCYSIDNSNASNHYIRYATKT